MVSSVGGGGVVWDLGRRMWESERDVVIVTIDHGAFKRAW